MKAMDQTKLAIRGICKHFMDPEGKRLDVLRGIDLEVRDHEFVSIIGPSGCGKSTLLFIIAGLIVPDDGVVTMADRVVRGPGRERGMVFQIGGYFPWRTVLRNVTYGPEIHGVGRAEREEIARRYLKLVGLAGFEAYYVHQLSGGMRTRLNLARTLANDPEILLMDEPFAAIDAQTKLLLQEELERIWEETAKTVVFVTHDLHEAVFLSDRVAIMSADGRVKQIVDVRLLRPRRHHIRKRTEFDFPAIYNALFDSIREEARIGGSEGL